VTTPSGTGRKIVGALLTKQLILIDPEGTRLGDSLDPSLNLLF
jgi:hypothetical protein